MQSRRILSFVLLAGISTGLLAPLGCFTAGGAREGDEHYLSESGSPVEVRLGKRTMTGAVVGPRLVATVRWVPDAPVVSVGGTTAGTGWICDGRAAKEVVVVQTPHGNIVVLSVSGRPFSQDRIFKMNPGGASEVVIMEGERCNVKGFHCRGTREFGAPVIDKYGFLVGHLFQASVVEDGKTKSRTVVLPYPQILDATALSGVSPKE